MIVRRIWVAVGLVTLLVAGSASASLILVAEQDTYIDQTNPNTVRDNPGTGMLSTAGILMKGQSTQERIGLVQFTLPDVEVTSASFNVYHFRSWSAGVSWNFRVFGKQASFDESTITWNNSSGITAGTTALAPAQSMAGGTGSGQDVIPGEWKMVDMTSFFNDNRGATVTLVLRCTSTGSNQGGTVEDREGSRTGDPANGPHVSYMPVPEPGTLMLVGLAVFVLGRRGR